LIGGADEVANLANVIEQVNTAMWQYGMHNLSGEVLGYLTKMNQLKHEGYGGLSVSASGRHPDGVLGHFLGPL